MSQGAFASICVLLGFLILLGLENRGAIEWRYYSIWPRLVVIACLFGGVYAHTLIDRWVVRSLREKERSAQGIQSSKRPGWPHS